MENASKALIIAGTTIIGVMIITIFVYVFREGSKVNEAYDQKQQNNQLELYNSKFEQYNRDNNTIMDIISLCNLAFSINEASKSSIGTEKYYDNTNAVEITVKNGNTVLFKIPNIIDNTREQIGKNQILNGSGEVKSIYLLASENIATLKDEKIDITNIHGAKENEKLSETRLANDVNKTIYKYLFKCENVSYKKINGQIESMTFSIYINNKETYLKDNNLEEDDLR